MKAIVWSLCAALILSGCSSGQSSGDKSTDKADVSSSVSSGSGDQSEGPVDYSKYNAYMDLYSELSDIEDILIVYFMNVDYTEEFSVLEDGDYAAIKDAVQFYTGHHYRAQDALAYVDEKPSYPEVDAAVRALGDSPQKMMTALDHLASYMNFNEFEDDHLAKAAEIHAELWEGMQVFGQYYGEMMDAMDKLADETREDDMAALLDEGLMILYHSRVLIHNSEDILSEIWNQIEVVLNATDPEAELVLPEIDMTNLSPLFEQFNTAYADLNEAMDSEEEQAKVFTGPVTGTIQLYKMRVDALYTQMGQLAQALLDGVDYGDIYDATSDALSGMINAYNMII